jgi:hypothetical protein
VFPAAEAGGAEGGDAPPAISSVPKGRAGTRPRRLPPSDNPREVRPGRQAESHSTTHKKGNKIYRDNFEDVVEVECFSALQSQKLREARPEGGGSGLVLGHYRETGGRVPVLLHIMLWRSSQVIPAVAFR